MGGAAEYVLGTDRTELERLREQHLAWLDQGRALWERAGLRGAGTVLDLGCGPGHTSLALAEFCGPEARVVAVDESEPFLAHLRGELAQRPGTRVEPLRVRIEELELPEASLDAAHARWVLSWLPDPAAAVERVAAFLKPGAPLVLQEYLHWGSFTLLPPHPRHHVAIRACLASWADVHVDAAAHVAAFAERGGLELELLEPIVRVGTPGSPVWTWLESFHRSYLPRLVDRGLLREHEVHEALEAWERHALLPGARVLAPTMAGVILRRPL